MASYSWLNKKITEVSVSSNAFVIYLFTFDSRDFLAQISQPLWNKFLIIWNYREDRTFIFDPIRYYSNYPIDFKEKIFHIPLGVTSSGANLVFQKCGLLFTEINWLIFFVCLYSKEGGWFKNYISALDNQAI